jgi:hypothetical protein
VNLASAEKKGKEKPAAGAAAAGGARSLLLPQGAAGVYGLSVLGPEKEIGAGAVREQGRPRPPL